MAIHHVAAKLNSIAFFARRTIPTLLFVVIALLLSARIADVGARDTGKSKETANIRGLPITIYTYRPRGCAAPTLLFVFHGLSRAASSYRNSAQALADQECMIVFAPLFDSERFPGWRYNRGGVVRGSDVLPRNQWTVEFVRDLVSWARQEEGRPDAPYYLFGHSAGGQFLSRVAAFSLPADAERIVIANPSTYVLPSLQERVPYGFKGIGDPAESERQLKKYLQLPLTIYLGSEDTGDEDLTQNDAAMRQGSNRLERGKFFYELGKQIADANGWEFRWRIVMASGIGHSGRGMLSPDQATEAFKVAEPDMVPQP
jgi:pimeloyl-ACP methyl ester carboxylesterase